MGSRNLDRISITASRPGAETVEAMINANFKVRARCVTCQLTTPVDLYLVATTRGPQTSLWDRDVHCRRKGCKGRMVFQANAPWMRDPRRYDQLAGRPETREPAYKRGGVGAAEAKPEPSKAEKPDA